MTGWEGGPPTLWNGHGVCLYFFFYRVEGTDERKYIEGDWEGIKMPDSVSMSPLWALGTGLP